MLCTVMTRVWVLLTLATMVMRIVWVSYWYLFLESWHLKKFDITKEWHTLQKWYGNFGFWLINGLSLVLWWVGLARTKNPMKIGREKQRAFTARHSNSPRSHHRSHSCIVLFLVVVTSLLWLIVKEIYNLVFYLAQAFPGIGFLTFPSMIVTLLFE